MPDNSNFLNNPLATIVLLMAAHTPDPVEKINSLNLTINSMREAIEQINAGLGMFNTEVMPMFAQPASENKEFSTRKRRR